MNTIKIKMIAMTIIALFLTIGCDDSPTGNTTPESATISGTITFIDDNCPTEDLAFGLYTEWPPTGPPAVDGEVISSNIINGQYSYTFTDPIPFETYSVLFVSWADVNDLNEISNQPQQYTLGYYGGTIDATTYEFSDPTSITVSTTDYAKTGINFNAYCSLINTTE